MITLFGATGYTGVLIARALERQSLPFRLAGRSEARLRALSARLDSHPAWLVADVSQPASLPALFAGARMLVNCVGPFTDLGEPVVAQAAARGVHYLDITNELAYVRRVQQYDRLARQTGAAIIPACAFEVAVSDLTLAWLARQLPAPPERAEVVYLLRGAGMSLGTRLSGLRIFATSWFTFRGGKYAPLAPASQLRRGVALGRPYAAVNFPSAEIVTAPAHLPLQEVRVWMAVSRRSAEIVVRAAPALSRLLRTPLGALAAAVLRRIWPPPADEAREQDRFTVLVELSAGAGAGAGGEKETRRAAWTGPDPYATTAEIIAWAAGRLLSAPTAPAGVLAPAQAFEAGEFVAWLRGLPGMALRDQDPG